MSLKNKIKGLRDCLGFSNRWWLVSQRLLRPSYPIVTYFWEKKWWLVCDMRYQDGNSPKELFLTECYHPYIRQSLSNGGCSYVNIGANIGAFDVVVADVTQSVPKALSVELNPKTYARLQFNLQINQLSYVKAINAGIAGKLGVFAFQSGDCSLSDSIYQSSEKNLEAESINVPLMPLQDVLVHQEMADEEFDLLKLDCEGAEYEIIRETSMDVLRKFRNIVMELHSPPADETVDALYEKLRNTGFTTGMPQWQPSTKETVLRFWVRSPNTPS